jgi:hypothetical protein
VPPSSVITMLRRLLKGSSYQGWPGGEWGRGDEGGSSGVRTAARGGTWDERAACPPGGRARGALRAGWPAIAARREGRELESGAPRPSWSAAAAAAAAGGQTAPLAAASRASASAPSPGPAPRRAACGRAPACVCDVLADDGGGGGGGRSGGRRRQRPAGARSSNDPHTPYPHRIDRLASPCLQRTGCAAWPQRGACPAHWARPNRCCIPPRIPKRFRA